MSKKEMDDMHWNQLFILEKAFFALFLKKVYKPGNNNCNMKNKLL